MTEPPSTAGTDTDPDEDLWREVPTRVREMAAEHDLDAFETARAWRMLVMQISPGECKSRIRGCETMAGVRAWVAVYNQLAWQLPPGYSDADVGINLPETAHEQAKRVRTGNTDVKPSSKPPGRERPSAPEVGD